MLTFAQGYPASWVSQVALVVKNPPARRCKRCGFDLWVRKIPWRRAWQPSPVFLPEESPRTEEWRAPVLRGRQSQTRL